jgi:hypothetical protein
MKKWNEYGWKQHTFAQMKDYKSKPAQWSAEIGCLDGRPRGGQQ